MGREGRRDHFAGALQGDLGSQQAIERTALAGSDARTAAALVRSMDSTRKASRIRSPSAQCAAAADPEGILFRPSLTSRQVCMRRAKYVVCDIGR